MNTSGMGFVRRGVVDLALGVALGSARLLANIGVVAGATVAITQAPAMAQFGPMVGGMNASTLDGFTPRAVRQMAKVLGLDTAQKEAAMELLEGHKISRQKIMTDFQESMKTLGEKAREDGDFMAFQKEMPKMQLEMQGKTEKLEKEFRDNLKGLLTPEQEGKWERAERVHRRSKLMRFSMVSGAGVDLVDVAERALGGRDKTVPKDVEDLLSEYEVQVDRHLIAIEKLGKDMQQKMMEDQRAMFDPQKMQDTMKPLIEKSAEIRGINRDFARRMLPLVSEDKRAEVELAIKRKAHPTIYRENHTQRSIAAALKMADLAPDQKESIQSMQASYEKDMAPLSDTWATATEEKEDKNGGVIGVMMSGFMGGGQSDDAVAKARTARRDLDKSVLERLQGILKPEQKSKLPERKTDSGNPFEAMMAPDEDEE
jgi:hypothetical protein